MTLRPAVSAMAVRVSWRDVLCEAAADALDADEPKDEPERERAAVSPTVEEAHCRLECECKENASLNNGWKGQEGGWKRWEA